MVSHRGKTAGKPPFWNAKRADAKAAQALAARSRLLGLALLVVERLAIGASHRPTGDGDRLASAGLSAFLALEVARPDRPAEDRSSAHWSSRENPAWGTPRIQAELRLLGHDLAESTVAAYMARPSKPPSPTWKAFLANHLHEMAAIDFFVVPTATFRLLYCFVVLSLDRRRVLHFNVTANPSAVWTAQQLREAFPYDTAPRFLQRDRDGVYGEEFKRRVRSMGIEEVVSAPRSPWQNPYVERLIGSVRRECLDHFIVLNETHLRRILVG